MQKSKGFSLLEILIAMALMALVLGTMGPKLIDYFKSGKKRTAKMHIDQMKQAILKYDMDVNGCPSTFAQLKTNEEHREGWDGPYMKEDIRDPWGNDYVYNKPPQFFTNEYKKYEIFSYGADGQNSDQKAWIHGGE